MATTLFRGGTIFDGTGSAGYSGHILVRDKRIEAVFTEGEELPGADEIVDVSGMAVAPGFIDMHSHGDWMLALPDHTDLARHLVEQGVTTIVGGNCGISPAPVSAESFETVRKGLASIAIDRPFERTWTDMSGFLDEVQARRPALNMAELAGHSTVRYLGATSPRGPLTDSELAKCRRLVRESLEQGACGLSLGLGYDPGMYSPLSELEALCEETAKADKPVTVHLKALSVISPCYSPATLQAHNVKALREMIETARKTGASLQVSHFIFVGRRTFKTCLPCIEMVEKARGEGVDVMFDAFPYTCGNTTINVAFPYWFLARLPAAYKNRLLLSRLKLELEVGFRLVGFIYDDFRIMDAVVPRYEGLNGLTIAEAAKKWNTSPFQAMLRLSEESRGAALMLYHTYSGVPGNEAPLEAVLKNDLCLFETDAAIKGRGYPNPAALGTFPRILGEMVRERKLFSLENAVRRMTSASAGRFGLKDRGELAAGKAADLVVFDPETISDTPPQGKSPAGGPVGIKQVFINGKKVVDDGVYTGGRAGEVLRV